MNRAAFLALLALPFLSAQTLRAETQPPAGSAPQKLAPAQAAAIKGHLLTAPLQFEENRGQAPAQYDYLSRGRECSVLLRSDEARVLVPGKKGFAQAALKLEAASSDKKGVALEPLPGTVNYFKGNDPAKWLKEVPTSGRIKYEGIYPGVDVVYYGNQQKLEYDFVVAPNADPTVIRWKAEGADKVKINADGALVLTVAGHDLLVKKPVAYQLDHGTRQLVEAKFKLADNQISFALNSYDRSKELVIDPVVQFVYSTYLGGTVNDSIAAIDVDKSGNIYVAGWTQSVDFPVIPGSAGIPTLPVLSGTLRGFQDAFVAKLKKLTLSGSAVISGSSARLLGGSGVAVSGSNIIVTGANLVISGSSMGAGPVSVSDAVVSGAGVTISGSNYSIASATQYSIAFATYLGGDANDEATGLALDSFNNIYVAGNTLSGDPSLTAGITPFPTTGGALQQNNQGGGDGFVTKLDSNGGIVYSTYIGSPFTEVVKGIAVNTSGEAYVAGRTEGYLFYGFPVVPLGQTVGGFLLNIKVRESKADGTTADTVNSTDPIPLDLNSDQPADIEGALNNTTILGADPGFRVQPGASYRQYVITNTTSKSFSLTATGSGGAFPAVGISAYIVKSGTAMVPVDDNGGTAPGRFWTLQVGAGSQGISGFLLRLKQDGSLNEVASSIIGGSGDDQLNAVAVDSNGVGYVTGQTLTFIKPKNIFEELPFVARLTAGIVKSFLLGDPTKGSTFSDSGWGSAIAIAGDGNVYIAGGTESQYFPVFNALETYPQTLDLAAPNDLGQSLVNGFVTKMDSTLSFIKFSSYLGGSKNDWINGISIDDQQFIYLTGKTESAEFRVLGDAAYQCSDRNAGAAFLAVLQPAGNAMRYCTFFGGSGVDEGLSVAVPPGANPIAYVGGYTLSTGYFAPDPNILGADIWLPGDFPTTPGAIQGLPFDSANQRVEGCAAGFVSAFRDQPIDLEVSSISSDVAIPVPGQPMTLTVTIKNLSSLDAQSVRVNQTLSNSLQLVSVQGSNITPFNGGSFDTTTKNIVADLGVVLANREVSYRIVVTPTGPQVVSTTATVQSEFDYNQSNNSLTWSAVARPVLSVSVPQPAASEDGTPGIFTITRQGDLSLPLYIEYHIGGTATNGTDYTTNGTDKGASTGTILLPAGSASVDLLIAPLADTVSDPNETVSVSVVKGADYELGTALSGTVTIADVPPNTVNLTVPDSDASKSGDPATFTISRTGNLGLPLTVNYSLAGTATNGVDYKIVQSGTLVKGTTGTVTIPANTTSVNVVITPIPDSESGRPVAPTSVIMQVQTASSYVLGATVTQTVNIADFVPDVVSVTAPTPSASAAGTSGTFRITRVGDAINDAANPLTVTYTMGGSAVNGTDYLSLTGMATIPAGASYVDVALNPTLVASGSLDKTAVLTLSPALSSSIYTLASGTTSATVTIAPFNGAVVTVTAKRTLASLTGTTGVLEFKRSGGDVTQALSVNYELGGSASPGTDYVLQSGALPLGNSVTFPANTTITNVEVKPIANPSASGSSTAIVTLDSSLPDYMAGSPASASVTVSNTAAVVLPVLNISVVSGSATETAGTLIFRITRTGDVSKAMLVNYTTAGSATNGIDYQTLTGGAAFGIGDTTADIVVTPIADNIAEPREVATVQLMKGDGYDLGASVTASGIIDDVPRNVFTLAVTRSTASESGTNAVFTVTRTGDLSQAIGVNYTVGGSATNGIDYQELNGTLAFPAGSASQEIVVQPVLDNLLEPTETVTIQLTPSTGYDLGTAIAGTATIENSVASGTPIVSLVVTQSAASEAGVQGVFTVNRAGDTSSVLSIPYTIGGTATNGVDYESLTGNLVIPAGESVGTIIVNPVFDGVFEPTESVIISLQPNVGYSLGSNITGVVSIANSETLRDPIVYVLATDSVATEAGDPATFTVYRAGNTDGAISVPYTMAGSATNGVDYETVSGNLVIPAGAASGQINILPIADGIAEPKESVIVTLGSGVGYTLGVNTAATATIENVVDNTVTVSATDPDASESGDPGVFTLTRTGNNDAALTVFFSLSGSGSNGVDYQRLASSATIPAGADSVDVTVTPLADKVAEGDESVVLTILPRDAYLVGADNAATVTIANVPAPTVSLSLTGTNAITEGSAATFLIKRSDVGAQPLTIKYTVAGSAASGTDYSPVSGSVTIAAGGTSAQVKVTTLVNAASQASPTLTLTLATSSIYNLDPAKSASVLIKNYSGPIITVSTSKANASESGTQGAITFTRSVVTASSLPVRYSIGGTAANGKDYTTLSGTATIPAWASSVTVAIKPIADSLAEGNETVILTATAGTGYLVGPANTGTVIIADSAPGIVSIVADPTATSAYEKGGQLRVFFSRTGSTSGAMSVAYTLGGTAVNGTDYKTLSGTISIPAGYTSATLVISTIDNSKIQPNRTIIVTGKITSGVVFGTSANSAILTILDDDMHSPTL